MKLWCVMHEDLQEDVSTLNAIFLNQDAANTFASSKNDIIENWETRSIEFSVSEWETED